MRPVIGISAREFKSDPLPQVGTFRPYIDAIIAAGGAPVVIPLSPEPSTWMESVVAALDGVLLTGGEDIEPARYAAVPHPELGTVSPLRDEVEAPLFNAARTKGIPILGICRGLQFINVMCGGTLYQDLPSELPAALAHADGSTKWLETPHSVMVEAGSLLEKAAGKSSFGINSLHHQAVRELGKGLRVTGRCARDGTVEAIEGSGPGWLLAVQWHPEVLWDTEAGAPHRAVFEAFVQAATRS
ncbi:MAG: gamma-glutamyl-gamma-aminobutyrate hydrolase family protein [Proteobacteria bacterium]|nr:gamma-glutamyl-gamma-aminobutyrate hydrolase family protein [Pseudomonadota bacterium]